MDALSVLPGSTETEFHEVAGKPSRGVPVEDVVEATFDALGRQPSVMVGTFNWLRANVGTRLLPRSVLTLVAKKVTEEQVPKELR